MPEQLGGLPAAGFTRIAAFGTLKTKSVEHRRGSALLRRFFLHCFVDT